MALEKTETVLDRDGFVSGAARFVTVNEEDGETGRNTVVLLDNQVWIDLGEPEQVTVTVKPGDHLNPRPES